MAAENLFYPKLKVFELSSTQVAAGAKVYTYIAGTSTDKTTYSDQGLTTPNTNPVICDSNGEAEIWLADDALYKIVINDSSDVLISSVDNVGPYEDTSTASSTSFNKVTNGSFEDNTGDNGTPSNWTLSINSGNTIQIDQANQAHGLSCLEFVGGATAAGSATSDFFAVQASGEVAVRFALKASGATVGQTVTVLWYQDDQVTAATPASTVVYTATSAVPTSWDDKYFAIVPGSDAVYGKIKIEGSTTSGTSYYDNIRIYDSTLFLKGDDLTTSDVTANDLALGTDGNYFDFTGTDTINSISGRPIGTVIKLHFDDAATLTHHATDLIIPGATNITTAAGDEAELICYATDDWRITDYVSADGQPIAPVNTAHIADSSVTAAKIGDATTGDFIEETAFDAAVAGISTTPLKILEIKMARDGDYTVYHAVGGTDSGTSSNVRSAIYKNGTIEGSTRSSPGSWTENITGLVVGDLIQIYGWETAGSGINWTDVHEAIQCSQPVAKAGKNGTVGDRV